MTLKINTDYNKKYKYTHSKHNFILHIKYKFLPRAGHEGPEEGRGIALSFYNFGARCVCVRVCVCVCGWSTPRPGRFTLKKKRGTRCVGGWVGPRGGLDGCRSSCLRRDPIPGPPIP